MNLRLIAAFFILLFFSETTFAQIKKSNRVAAPIKQELALPNVSPIECDIPAQADMELLKVEVTDVTSYSPGATMTVSALVRNSGQCETGPFNVKIKRIVDYHGTTDHEWVYFRVNSLEPYNGHNVSASDWTIKYSFITHPQDKVHYRFSVEIDPDNQVNEFVENNNSLYRGAEFVFSHSSN